MPRRSLLDTSVLIGYWRQHQRQLARGVTAAEVERWARWLIEIHDADVIATPVYIEFVAGVTSGDELRLARAYLAPYRLIDRGNVSPAEWDEAARIAQRVPRDSKPRRLGDCLIRAIARRHRYEVISHGKSFPS